MGAYDPVRNAVSSALEFFGLKIHRRCLKTQKTIKKITKKRFFSVTNNSLQFDKKIMNGYLWIYFKSFGYIWVNLKKIILKINLK